MTNYEFYCIIPARGGSKRIPNKNTQLVAGTPLIIHTIENAKKSGAFKSIFVSTDSQDIANMAVGVGAFAPSLRSKSLSNDVTPTRPVIADFIMKHKELQGENVVICCLYPFAILVPPDILRKMIEVFAKSKHKDRFLVSVKRYPHPIQRALLLDSDGVVSPLNQKNIEARTQDLSTTFHDAGQFYFALAKTWMDKTPILMNAIGYELKKFDCVDVDNLEDLEELRIVYKMKRHEWPHDKAD
jgi:N-acylneuraminate cytidylyltransferase